MATHPAAFRSHPDSHAPDAPDLTPRLAAADWLDEHGRHREAVILRDTRRHAFVDFGGRIEDAGELVRQLNEGFNPNALMDNFTRRYVTHAIDPQELGPHPDTGGAYDPGDVTHQTLAAMIADAHHIRALHEHVPQVSHTPAGETLWLSREYPAVREHNDSWFGGIGWHDHPIHAELHDYANRMGRHPLRTNPIAPGLVMSDLALGGYSVPHPDRVPPLPDPYDPSAENPTMNAAQHYAARPATPPGGTYRYRPLPQEQQGQAQYDDEMEAGYPPGYTSGPNPPPQFDPLGRPTAGTTYPGPLPGAQQGGYPPTQNPAPDAWGHTDPMGHPYAAYEYDAPDMGMGAYHDSEGMEGLPAVLAELQGALRFLSQCGPHGCQGQYADEPTDDDDQYSPEDQERFAQQDEHTQRDRDYRQRQIEEDIRQLEERRNRRQPPPHYAAYGHGEDFPLPYDFGDETGPVHYGHATNYADPALVARIKQIYNELKNTNPGVPVTAQQVRMYLPAEMRGGAMDAMRGMMRARGYSPPTGKGSLSADSPQHWQTRRPYMPVSGMNRTGPWVMGNAMRAGWRDVTGQTFPGDWRVAHKAGMEMVGGDLSPEAHAELDRSYSPEEARRFVEQGGREFAGALRKGLVDEGLKAHAAKATHRQYEPGLLPPGPAGRPAGPLSSRGGAGPAKPSGGVSPSFSMSGVGRRQVEAQDAPHEPSAPDQGRGVFGRIKGLFGYSQYADESPFPFPRPIPQSRPGGRSIQKPYCHYMETSGNFHERDRGAYYEESSLTPEKARMMLKDGTANGRPLTDRQRRFFGAIASKG